MTEDYLGKGWTYVFGNPVNLVDPEGLHVLRSPIRYIQDRAYQRALLLYQAGYNDAQVFTMLMILAAADILLSGKIAESVTGYDSVTVERLTTSKRFERGAWAAVETALWTLLAKNLPKSRLTIATEGGAAPEKEVAKKMLSAGREISQATRNSVQRYSDKALSQSLQKHLAEINRHKEILKNATPEQVRSITKDIIKHKDAMRAITEEISERGLTIIFK